MCKPKVNIPKVTVPKPPKRGIDAPEIATEEEDLDSFAYRGLDKLRIDRTSPAASVPPGQAGVQIGR